MCMAVVMNVAQYALVEGASHACTSYRTVHGQTNVNQIPEHAALDGLLFGVRGLYLRSSHMRTQIFYVLQGDAFVDAVTRN